MKCHEFSKTLEYIYFGDIYDENDGFETSNINFLVYDFSGQATIPTDNCLNALFAGFFWIHHCCIQNLIKHRRWSPFANIVNNIKFSNISAKGSIVDVCQSSEFVFEYVQDFFGNNMQQLIIPWVFFGICINFVGENFVQIK